MSVDGKAAREAASKADPKTALEMCVQPMKSSDVPDVIALAAEVPTAPHWPPAEFSRMLGVVEHNPARRGVWVARSASGEMLGFAIASHVAGIAELEAVVTAARFREQGVGSALAETVLAWARVLAAERLILEVRTSNHGALRLYRRLGFRQDGVRARYYRNPEEDAILMSCVLR